MKIAIPNNITIGAFIAQVVIKDNLSGDDGYKGSYNQRTSELNIDSALFGEIRDRVFLHELMHVIALNYEVHLAEDDITRLANGLYEFLMDAGIELDWCDIEVIEQ